MRRQGFFGAAMLPMSELEYTGIVEKLGTLTRRDLKPPLKCKHWRESLILHEEQTITGARNEIVFVI